MINRVVVRNFKKFEELDFKLKDRLVIAGPNNSGKTTLLQAIGMWSEIACQWREKGSDLTRDKEGNYISTSLNLLKFHSVPLIDFDHLWKDKNIRQPASVNMSTGEWKLGFEVVYKEAEVAAIRPTKEAKEDDLYKYIINGNFPAPVYIPPISGIEVKEPFFDPVVIPARLARMQAGNVLRNLLFEISRDREKWSKLQDIVKSFFGYELEIPSSGPEILARYRHSAQDLYYDLSSAASGFLQVLMVYAVLLSREASIVLIDEPDAHLHLLLQDKMYRNLCEYARKNKSQLIVSTHSESLIKVVDPLHLCVLRSDHSKTVTIIEGVKHDALTVILRILDNNELALLQEAEKPRILYVEGLTDIHILREWAKVLDHHLSPFLEEPFWKPAIIDTPKHEKSIKAEDHFGALKLLREDVAGIELHDSDNKMPEPKVLDNGLVQIFWKRYEIESYLIHPEAIARFVESVAGETAVEKVRGYMRDVFPPVVFKNPLEDENSILLVGTKHKKPKDLLSKILSEAGVYESDYSRIAALMKKEEIHPEVTEKLDKIADCLGIGKE